jgi:hypothetical protein
MNNATSLDVNAVWILYEQTFWTNVAPPLLVILRSMLRLLVTANIVLDRRFLPP